MSDRDGSDNTEEFSNTSIDRAMRAGLDVVQTFMIARDEHPAEIEAAGYLLYRYDDLAGRPLGSRRDYVNKAALLANHFGWEPND